MCPFFAHAFFLFFQVHYCGLCHSDVFTKLGMFGNTFPRVPGHEVAGVVDAVGPNVSKWTKGDRWVTLCSPPVRAKSSCSRCGCKCL